MRKSVIAALAFCGFFAIAYASAQPRPSAHARIQRAGPVAPAEDGYFSGYVTGPTGTKVPIRRVPGSATVITRKMMDDFQANTICDALHFAPGVIASGC